LGLVRTGEEQDEGTMKATQKKLKAKVTKEIAKKSSTWRTEMDEDKVG
jgi:hypothetical protein